MARGSLEGPRDPLGLQRKPGCRWGIIAEFDNWRRIRDFGRRVTDWVWHSAVSRDAAPRSSHPGRARTARSTCAPATARPRPWSWRLEPGVVSQALCPPCFGASGSGSLLPAPVRSRDSAGWVHRTGSWGVYPGERVDDRAVTPPRRSGSPRRAVARRRGAVIRRAPPFSRVRRLASPTRRRV